MLGLALRRAGGPRRLGQALRFLAADEANGGPMASPMPAAKLIAEVPPIQVHSSFTAVCDGGGQAACCSRAARGSHRS